VLVAYWTKRSSWAVYGTIGFFIATDHYLGLPAHSGPVGGFFFPGQQCTAGLGSLGPLCTPGPSIKWAVALAYGLLGFWLVGLGMLGTRKRGPEPAAVVVTTPAPPAATEPAAE